MPDRAGEGNLDIWYGKSPAATRRASPTTRPMTMAGLRQMAAGSRPAPRDGAAFIVSTLGGEASRPKASPKVLPDS
jgi:hypothetical protein